MQNCDRMSTDQYIYVGLAIYGAVCCTVSALWQCYHDRLRRSLERAAHPIPPLVEETEREPPPYSTVV